MRVSNRPDFACAQVRQAMEQFASASAGEGSKPKVIGETVVVSHSISLLHVLLPSQLSADVRRPSKN